MRTENLLATPVVLVAAHFVAELGPRGVAAESVPKLGGEDLELVDAGTAAFCVEAVWVVGFGEGVGSAWVAWF